jgi:GNAT superfamily N-acetyltransferase
VVVRKIVGERDGRPVFSDVVGELVDFTDEHLTVRDEDGNNQQIPRILVAAAKPIPPRRAAYRDIVALERVAAAGWPAHETGRIGRWLLRAAEGWTSRANSVLPLGHPGVGLDRALDQVRAWYAARDLTPQFAVPLPAFRSLDRELTNRGWQPTHRVLVQTASLPELLTGLPGPDRDLPPITVTPKPGADWLRMVGDRKGGLPDGAARVLTGARLPGFASAYESGELLAIGRGVVDDGWLGLSLVEVVPGARRRGLARHVLAALARWGAEHRAERAYLQVEPDNAAALALYAGFGFSTHHSYLGRDAPAA